MSHNIRHAEGEVGELPTILQDTAVRNVDRELPFQFGYVEAQRHTDPSQISRAMADEPRQRKAHFWKVSSTCQSAAAVVARSEVPATPLTSGRTTHSPLEAA